MIHVQLGLSTTSANLLSSGEVVQTIPSIGWNVETVRLKARGRTDRVLNLTCWDVGGCSRDHLTYLTVQHAIHADAIIWFVVRLKHFMFGNLNSGI